MRLDLAGDFAGGTRWATSQISRWVEPCLVSPKVIPNGELRSYRATHTAPRRCEWHRESRSRSPEPELAIRRRKESSMSPYFWPTRHPTPSADPETDLSVRSHDDTRKNADWDHQPPSGWHSKDSVPRPLSVRSTCYGMGPVYEE